LEQEQGKTPSIASFKNFLTKTAWHEASHLIEQQAEKFKAALVALQAFTENYKLAEFKHKFTWEQTDRRVMKGEDD
jgi:hypothetical protein